MAFGVAGTTLNSELNRLANGGTYRTAANMVDKAKAAQQWAAVERSVPGAAGQIAKGDFSGINAWRNANIWSKASMFSTPEIMRQATGEPLNAKYFEQHLRARYLG